MEEVRGQAHHVGVAIEGEDVLGEFLDWVFGEDTETTANDATEKPSPSQEPQTQGEQYPAPFPSLVSQLLSATFSPSAAGTTPDQSSKRRRLRGLTGWPDDKSDELKS